MRLVCVQPRQVFLLLAILLVLSPLFQSIYKQRDVNLSSNPLIVFLLCNILILAIIVGDHRPPNEEVENIDAEDVASNNYNDIDENDDHVNGNEDADDQVDESEEETDIDSDGYDEDDDDDGSSDESGWGDADESDDNLRTRVEDFIDRVYKGWQEDRLRDSRYNPMQIFSCIHPL